MSHLWKKVVIYIVYIFALSIKTCVTEDILGCGGFIKSHTDIDFTKVKIKLYTKTGSLKDQTECAPNNGYYFLPLYDKGEYILKVDPPRGWSFEPTEVSLNFDGITDTCSQGKDINFTFKGFGITGKVTSKKSNSGPKDITVSLYNENNKSKALKATVTDQDGTFYFTPIQPGKYILIASHPVWMMDKNIVSVTVKEGNTELPDNSLVVFGYDVSGRVTSEGDSVSGVSFLLFGNGEAKNCATTPIKGYKLEKPICHVTSGKNGRFTFPAVSYGQYRVVPFYAGAQTKFDVQPAELSFKIIHDSLFLPQDFKVSGFSVSGLIKNSENGSPLPGAKVFLSGKQVAITDQNGKYKVDNVRAGQYQLKAEADNVIFEEKVIKVFPNNPELPTISPSSYKICGKVTLSAKGTVHHRKISIQNDATTFIKNVETDPETGEFCLYLSPDKYHMNVIVSDEEKNKGLQFFPLQHTIDVSSGPVKDVNFLQLKATLKGTIECLKNNDCSQAMITLKVLGGITIKTVQTKDDKYEFKEVLPGHYEVLIDTDILCWESSSYKVIVSSEFAQVPPFKQTGFSMTIISSHSTMLEYTRNSKKIVLNLTKGSTRHCLPEQGQYTFEPKGCHVYPKSSFSWDTNSQSPLILSSTEHQHKGSIVSASAVNEVKVKIESNEEPLVLGPLTYKKMEDDIYKYEFEFNAIADNTYIIVPISDVFLFNPSSSKVVGVNECQDNIATFMAELGKIISGSIAPPLDGVTIKIFGKDKENPVHTLVTQADGKYKIGPLNAMIDYSITVEKDGYVVSGPDAKGTFTAHKLAEIIVEVYDQANNVTLQSVLLSLTGGDSYRKNSMTGDNGQMIFNSLSPGKYYLRPMMKEYRFDPPSKMINVEEGSTITVKLLGNRVAFSAYGIVTSLNGEPEPGLLIEAQGQAECSDLQEEATTEENGHFRIRGLQPTCVYAIRFKADVEANSRIQRAVPSSIAVQATEDVYNLRLIVFRSISRVDVTVHVIASQPEHYRTLKVKLSREDHPDSPMHVTKLDNQHISSKISGGNYNAGHLIHFPTIQTSSSGNNKYMVQLESSLSRGLHKYQTIPVYFEANSSFKYIKMTFNTERKHDHGDMSQTSVVALPFIMIVAFAFLYRDKLWSCLNTVVERCSKPAPVSRTPVHAIPIDPRADDIIVEQIMNINKRKTKPRKV